MKKEKKKETKPEQASFFKELGGFMKPYYPRYALSVVTSILSVSAKLASYAFVGVISGLVFAGSPDIKKIFTLALWAALCKILNAVLLNYSTQISHNAAYPTLKDIRNALTQKMMKIPMGYFEENGSGRLKTMLADKIEEMEKTLAHMIPELTANLLAPLLLMVWMFFIDWRLTLISLVWIILGFSVTGGMMKGYEEKYAGQIKAYKGMNQAVVEYVNGIEVIKNFGRADECYKKYEDAVYNHASYNLNWMKETELYSALGMSTAPFSIFPVLAGGIYFYSKGTLAPDSFFMMILLTLGIFGPLMQSMNYFDQIMQMGTNAKEIRDVLDYPELKRGSDSEVSSCDVEFKDVCFTYSKGGKNVLNNISFKLSEGKMLALTGPSGSGKSTVAKLLSGYWDPSEGEISIGGKALSSLSQEKLNSLIAFVDQDTFLFDTTILENIRMGKPSATDEEVIEASKKAGCHEFIEALPDGYKTSAGLAGSRLSGGEKQRISIARAILKNAPIMILDEATSSSDPENEAYIQKSLSQAAKGKTLIVIAHRLSTIVNADIIAFISDGKVEKTGTHQELLASCPEYKNMWLLAKEE